MKKIITFLGLFVLAGAISIGGHWPSTRGAVVLPRPDLVSQTAAAPNPVAAAPVHTSNASNQTPGPTVTPVIQPVVTQAPSASVEPSPWATPPPTPIPVDSPIPSPHPTCPPCGGYGQGTAQIMCPMIACRE